MQQGMIFFPNPKKIAFTGGSHVITCRSIISFAYREKLQVLSTSERLQSMIENAVNIRLQIVSVSKGISAPGIFFCQKADMRKESYALEIEENRININYSDSAGAFYAVMTLRQIIMQCGKIIPCLKIEDWPDFEFRGIMLDISRNRIPTLNTLYGIVDFMSELRLNQLQLYIEGFSFAYPSFPEVWKDQTPITGEEIMLLDRYCKERYIDLVPNQNSFGHMAPWLSHKAFNEFAECPDGCYLEEYGWKLPPFSLNPLEPHCISFVESMYEDLLPNFSSKYFNIGLDETMDLGRGKSRKLCEAIGKGRVYLDFLKKIYELVKKQGKTMMLWGDIIKVHPELIPELPKDIIVLEWGYGPEEPTAEICEKFMNTDIPYYVCPGTSSWDSISGMTDNMKANLLKAAVLGKKYKASGYLNTDWGTSGHWQHLPVSYAGFCYGAALSWGVEENINADIAAYLDRFVFYDRSNRIGNFVLDFGNYYLKEIHTNYNGSGIFRTLQYSMLFDRNTDLKFLNLPNLDKKDFQEVGNYVRDLYKELDKVEMHCIDARSIEAEFRNAIRLILHGVDLGLFKLEEYSQEEKKCKLDMLITDINEIIKDYKEVWLKRNRLGGLDESIKKMEELKTQYMEYRRNELILAD